MQIHPSTKKLIDRLYDMTLERKIAWKQGADGSVVYDTERYRVSLVGSPTEVILSSDTGAELDKADHEELKHTLLEDGTTYAEYVGQLHKEAHRIARGAESAIDDLLATLDNAEADDASAPTAPVPVPAPALTPAEKKLDMPEPSDEVEETISEPAAEELSSEHVADAVANMAKTVNADEPSQPDETSEPAPIEEPEPVVADTPKPELSEPIQPGEEDSVPEPVTDASTDETEAETTSIASPPLPPADPEPAPPPPRPQITGGGFGFGGLGQPGFANPPVQAPKTVEPDEPAEEPEAAAPAPQAPIPPAPPVPPVDIGTDTKAEEDKEEPDVPTESMPEEKPATPPPLAGGGYTPSPFGIMTQRGPAQPPSPPTAAAPPPIVEDRALPTAAEPEPETPQPKPIHNAPSLGTPPAGSAVATNAPVPQLPDMEPGVEESKIANLVDSITETVDDDSDAEPEELTTVTPSSAPAAVSSIADVAGAAIKRPGDASSQSDDHAAESLKERSIGVIDETGEVIRKDADEDVSETTADPEPPKPPSKRFNPWR